MFTGIVQSQAEVISIDIENNLARLIISVQPLFITELALGASIAINGVCLTVVSFEIVDSNQASQLAYISFDVIEETLKVSNLSKLKAGDLVNIERSLKFGDELGGHVVSGHVHCQAALIDKQESDSNCSLFFNCHLQWGRYILDKGFISINGISLTVGKVNSDESSTTFSVHLIPETLARTNLSSLLIADKVNIEFDQQTITIVTTLERMKLSAT